VLLVRLSLAAIDKGAEFRFITLCTHTVGDDDVFKAAFLADVIIL
jgi:hypothetical protein